ncbi:MAG: NAD(P)-dependent oxidoreductase [Actinomycetota bacterium]
MVSERDDRPIGSGPPTLVTGAMGCLGAWVLHHLVEAGRPVVAFDLSTDRRRPELIMGPDRAAEVTYVTGDLTSIDDVSAAVIDHGVERIIHLAALQIPFCRDDPIRGAQVNVVGTANVFEAARRQGIRHLTYASSVAVYGPADVYPAGPLGDGTVRRPATLYGAYKVANEDMAAVYWADDGLSSIGLRPYTVYGPGRDQGLTSDPTAAMLAAVAGRPAHIGFGGAMQFHHASDTARQFIAAADLIEHAGAGSFDLGGTPATVAEVIEHIRSVRPDAAVTAEKTALPFPSEFTNDALRAAVPEVYHTPLAEGVAATMAHFEAALADGRLAP